MKERAVAGQSLSTPGTELRSRLLYRRRARNDCGRCSGAGRRSRHPRCGMTGSGGAGSPEPGPLVTGREYCGALGASTSVTCRITDPGQRENANTMKNIQFKKNAIWSKCQKRPTESTPKKPIGPPMTIALRSCQRMTKKMIVRTMGAIGSSIQIDEYPACAMMRDMATYVRVTAPTVMMS